MMEWMTFTTIFLAFVASTTGLTLDYKCIGGLGPVKTIQINLKGEPGDSLVNAYFDSDIECVYATTYNTDVDVVVDGSGVQTCGVTGSVSSFTLTLTTVSSADNIVQSSDREFTMACDFTEKSQVITAESASITGGITAGESTNVGEDIKLSLVNGGSSDTCAIGDTVSLRVTLTVSVATLSVKVRDCTASDGVVNGKSLVLIPNDGCPTKILTTNNGFKQTSVASASKWVAESGTFGCFMFTSTTSLLLSCTAEYLTTEVAKSCASDGRLKREISDPSRKKKNILVLVRVSAFNSTVATRSPSSGTSLDACNHRSYIIGLVILGCVLVLTVVVTVGMFVVVRRGRSNSDGDKMAYVNNGMS